MNEASHERPQDDRDRAEGGHSAARKEYLVVYEQGPRSWSTYVPDLPGVFAAGDTREETNGEGVGCSKGGRGSAVQPLRQLPEHGREHMG